ncbi:putative heme-binding peroxidase [Venturia nashicola]|nr:putative heme-binding peroxidase [Venturia nashicola]
MATANPTFLGLPQELRDEIYRLLIVSNHHIIHCPVRRDSSDDDSDREFEHFSPKSTLRKLPCEHLPTAILRVSREIHHEAQQIMLRENTFIIDFRNLTEDCNGPQDLFPQEVFKQAFRLHIIADDSMWHISTAAKFLELDTCFRSLHLEFRRSFIAFFRLGENGEEWLERMDHALYTFRMLKKVGVQNVKVSNWTFLKLGLPAAGSLKRRFEIMEDFAKKLETEMRKNFST